MLHVGILLFNDIELMDFTGPYEVFSCASELFGHMFQVFTVSEDGHEIRTVNGLRVIPDFSFNRHPAIDVLVIPGGIGSRREMANQAVLDWVAAQHKNSSLTMSVCSGARILGRLGLLDGIPFTTHHELTAELREIAPLAELVEGVRFVGDGRVMTSGGISAGIDLSLHVVETLCGQTVAGHTRMYMEYGNWEEIGISDRND